jgi:hypothetical protein
VGERKIAEKRSLLEICLSLIDVPWDSFFLLLSCKLLPIYVNYLRQLSELQKKNREGHYGQRERKGNFLFGETKTENQ